MIKLQQIRTLAENKDFEKLKELHSIAKTQGIENCDNQMLSTLNLCVLECCMFKNKSQGHLRSLFAMLDAIEHGNHPYDDIIASSTFEAEAAIARSELNAVIKK